MEALRKEGREEGREGEREGVVEGEGVEKKGKRS